MAPAKWMCCLAALVGAATLRPTPVAADPVAVGDLFVDANGFPNLTGTVTFDDATFDVFDTPVDLGTAVGTVTFTVQISNFNLTRGGDFAGQFMSVVAGQLAFDEAGSFICGPGGCTQGAALVGDLSNVTGTALAGLPGGVVYVGDGAALATGSLLFSGRIALNAFQPVVTSTGTNQTVSSNTTFYDSQTGDTLPIAVDVTYADVTTGGTTVVTTVSNVAGQLAANFSLGGLPAAFFDVSTTATVSGPITVCTHYQDTNDDGIVDDTSVAETSLALLHEVGGIFVNVTTSQDTAGNVICGTVPSLSLFVVAVRTNRPPDCSAAAPSLRELWPLTGRLVAVAMTGVTDPDGDAVTTTITGVSQDEPLNGGSDGNTCPDAGGVGSAAATLRAERNGHGDGRMYHVMFASSDGQGGECTGTVSVCVPYNQRKRHFCVDQGPLVDSTGPCP